jgi:hypothetical protein
MQTRALPTRRLIILPLLLVLLITPEMPAQTMPTGLPWEDPNTGFDSPGTSGGQTAIEPVIQTSGGSKDNGTKTSDAGTEQQQSFVNGFLNDAAEKIKAANGGSGWVWTWQKKWIIGPDGKPTEVTEQWHQGTINGAGTGAPVTTAPPRTTSTTPVGPVPPRGPPTTSSGPGSPTGPTSGSTPGTPPTSTTTGRPPAPPPAVPPAGRPIVPNDAFDPAPPDLPDAEVRLVIQNPATAKETAYPRNVFPNLARPVPPLLRCKNEPVPEDTRVKITLDFDQTKLKREDLSLTIIDSEGNTLVPPEEMGTYRHIFRVPDMTPTYEAVVTYKHPLTNEVREVMRVAIPVYPLDFKHRTVEHEQSRTDLR